MSFGDHATEDLFHGRATARVRRFPVDTVDPALLKLDSLNGTSALLDLRSLPGNSLETLRGDSQGWYSLRVNEHWRLVFRWTDSDATDVRLADYHREEAD